MSMAGNVSKWILSLVLVSFGARTFEAVAQPPRPGQLVAVIASKGQLKGPTDIEGMTALADVAHKRNFPVTWLLKPAAAADAAEKLKAWNRSHGDEVAWFAEYAEPSDAEEFNALKKAVGWQKITSAGTTRYGDGWVRQAEKFGITGVWGRCFEQTDADNIIDRGSPFGFYYLRPDCYKVPSTGEGGVVSVPWMSSDINLVFRTGWASGFTFDPTDVLNIGVVRSGNIDYWKSLVDEYAEQTAFNAVVPLVIQQEYAEVGEAIRRKETETLDVLGELLDYLKEKNIRVVSMAQAVELYRKANPRRTPPTYALFDNLGVSGLAAAPEKNPKTGRLHKLQVSSSRFTKASGGKAFNGFFTTDFKEGTRWYFHPEGKSYREHGKLFTYYDERGLLMFDEGVERPVRLTPYGSLPMESFKPRILPEMSVVYDTANYIPEPVIERKETPAGLALAIQVAWRPAAPFTQQAIPYGVMVWGDFSRYQMPAAAPAGSRLIGTHGAFLNMPLKSGTNTLQVMLTKVR